MKKFQSFVLLAALGLTVFQGCSTTGQYNGKDPEILSARERLRVAREAAHAAEDELKALQAKKRAEADKAKAEEELKAAQAKAKSAVQEASRAYDSSAQKPAVNNPAS